MGYTLDMAVQDTGIDYLRLNAEDEGGQAWIWNTWNNHLENTEGTSATLTPRRHRRGQSLTWESMGVMWQRMGQCSLWASGEAASMLARVSDISMLSASRVDIQVSGPVSEAPRELARQMYQYWTGQKKGKVARMGCTLVQSKTGDTVYLGGRTAPRFLRIYDKGGKEGTHPQGHYWRIEIEYKRQLAQDMFTGWLNAHSKEAFVRAHVMAHLASVNVQTGLLANSAPVKIPLRARETSAASMIGWLEKSVRPVVVKLNRMGYTDDMYRALGLPSRRD